MPVWVRVPGIIALVLVGMLTSSMLLGAADIEDRGSGGGHGSGDDTEMDRGGHGAGDDTEMDRGGHGADDGSDDGDHGSD